MNAATAAALRIQKQQHTAALLARIDALQKRDPGTVHRMVGALAVHCPHETTRILDRLEAELEALEAL